MVALSSLELDVKLGGLALPTRLPPVSAGLHLEGRVPKAVDFDAPSDLARQMWYGRSQSSRRQDGILLLHLSRQDLFSDPTQLWNHRESMPSSESPEFQQKKPKVGGGLNNSQTPVWMESRTRTWGEGISRPPEFISTSVRRQRASAVHQGNSELEMCRELCENGRVSEAVTSLERLVQRGISVPNNLFYRVLKRCSGDKDLVLGRRIHVLTVESGYEGDAFLATHLIGLYAAHGILDEAMQVFSKVSKPDAYNWATIIFAFARQGEAAQAIRLYRQMRRSNVKPDNRAFSAVIKACATAGDLVAGKEVHAHILEGPGKPDIFVLNGLLDMYAKCRSLQDACRLFDRISNKDVVTWTAMIAGYALHGMGQEALTVYSGMCREGLSPPDSVTFICLLQACASVGEEALHEGKKLHSQIMKEKRLQDDVVLGCSLVNMYAKCGSLEDARSIFDLLPEKNMVTWNAMLAGYSQQGLGQEALSLYSSMERECSSPPSPVTFVCLLQACAGVGADALPQGKQLHAQIEEQGLQNDVVIGCSLVNMYAKCNSLEDARKVFNRLPEKNVVTWTAMIAGYAQQGMGQEALSLYSSMRQEGSTPPNSATFICLLQACAIVAALPFGKQLHADIQEQGLQADTVVGAALVNMYAKCGSMSDSQLVFDALPQRTLEAWDALIGGYTCEGSSEAVFDLFDRMRLEGLQPTGSTFLKVLTLCSHVGLVEKGRMYFDVMRMDCGVSPTVNHYSCMMDLLGRAGHLDEALQMANTMPFPANASVWHTLLGACRKWNSVEIGQQAFECAVKLDPKDAASYVLMSNIYAKAQMWEKADEIEARRVQCGAWKEPGQCWWTDKGGVVHTFVVGQEGVSRPDV